MRDGAEVRRAVDAHAHRRRRPRRSRHAMPADLGGSAQTIAGGAVAGRRQCHKPDPTARNAKAALAAHNSSARSGCKRCGARNSGANEQDVWGGQDAPAKEVAIIRHATTPATKSATAISDASTVTSHGRLTIGPTISRTGAVGTVRGEIPSVEDDAPGWHPHGSRGGSCRSRGVRRKSRSFGRRCQTNATAALVGWRAGSVEDHPPRAGAGCIWDLDDEAPPVHLLSGAPQLHEIRAVPL
jgi:hypothetical protein